MMTVFIDYMCNGRVRRRKPRPKSPRRARRRRRRKSPREKARARRKERNSNPRRRKRQQTRLNRARRPLQKLTLHSVLARRRAFKLQTKRNSTSDAMP